MIGSHGAAGQAVDAILAIISDPEGTKKRLKEIRAAEKKASDAEEAARAQTQMAVKAGGEAEKKVLKAETASGVLSEARASLHDERQAFAAEKSAWAIDKQASVDQLAGKDAGLRERESALKAQETDMEKRMSAIGARESRAESLTASANEIIEAAGLLGKKKLA